MEKSIKEITDKEAINNFKHALLTDFRDKDSREALLVEHGPQGMYTGIYKAAYTSNVLSSSKDLSPNERLVLIWHIGSSDVIERNKEQELRDYILRSVLFMDNSKLISEDIGICIADVKCAIKTLTEKGYLLHIMQEYIHDKDLSFLNDQSLVFLRDIVFDFNYGDKKITN